jgi:glucan endo-1,6-beta-glucosidase
MLPDEWVRMGGETCFQNASCADCAASEFDLVKKLGQDRADTVFQEHWQTWFAESNVQAIVDAGLNTVRVPVSIQSFMTPRGVNNAVSEPLYYTLPVICEIF